MIEALCPQDCGLPKFFRLKKSEMQWDEQTTLSSVWSC